MALICMGIWHMLSVPRVSRACFGVGPWGLLYLSLQQPAHSEEQRKDTGAIQEKCLLCGSVSGIGPWMQLGSRLWQELTFCIMVVLCLIFHLPLLSLLIHFPAWA